MPRLLIVSPHFPPVNAPDMQRVRMSLPYFVEAGWEVTVLTADDREPTAPVEPDLVATVPPEVRVARVRCLSRRWTRFFGLNNLGWRVLPFLARAGGRLLAQGGYDVVYFSTTQFIVLPLGRLWWRRFGTPYVIDLQDPWWSDYYGRPGAPRPPGGWKYRFANLSARWLEGWTLRHAARIISVSEDYLTALARRYPWWRPELGAVLAFGASDRDFALAREKAARQPRILPDTPSYKIAYTGRLGPDMQPALEVLFRALAGLREADRFIEVFFFGTTYAPEAQARSSTVELAARHGLAERVHEFPGRIGYLDALRIMLESDLNLLLGSDDTAYSPSKIYPVLLAKRPALALAPAHSVLEQRLRELGGAHLVTFLPETPGDAIGGAALRELIGSSTAGMRPPPAPPLNSDRFERQYSAAAVAARQLDLLAGTLPSWSRRAPDRSPSGA